MNKRIWCISNSWTQNRILHISGYESRRMAYREANKQGKQVIICDVIGKKFSRPAQPVPKKKSSVRKKKKRK